jgi:hypothetical protein
MWDLALSRPRWSRSAQKASLAATVLFVASFLCSLVLPSVALAADATWAGQNLSYNGKTYTKAADIKAGDKRNPIEGTHVYEYTDTQAKTLEVLYIDKGTPDVTKATMAQYVIYKNFTPPDTFSEMSSPQTVTITGTPSADTKAGTSTCDSSIFEGLGWVLCPLSNLLAKAVDNIYGIISSFLVVTTLTTDQNNSIFKIWQIIVSLANMCFIFAFLYVVYLHLVSVNVEKYHLLKKALPRMLIAAILVNISYWVCALAVDVSNLLGYSVERLFAGVRESVGLSVHIDWSAITSFILSAGAVGSLVGFAAATGGSLISAGFLLISMLVSVVLAAMVAFIILAARQALIVIFIIVSPLAFVAWTLPNTEKYFKRWFDTFMTLLMLFPIFSALFGGSMLAGAAIMNSANGSLVIALIGMAVQIVPLALTPLIIKFSTGLLGQIANITNNQKRGLADRTRNWAQDNSKHHRLRKLSKNDNMVGRNPLLLGNPARLARSMDRSRRRREMMDKDNEDLLGNRADEDYQQRTLRSNRGQYQRMRNRRLDSHSMHERASTYKQRLDSMGEEHWADELRSSSELQSIKRQSHVATGSAKVITDAIEQANERALQETIRTNADLRGQRIQAATDQGIAKLNAAEVDAAGELELKNVVLGDRALRKMVVDTTEMENRAEVAEEIVKKRAQANWDYISKSDKALQRLRLQATQESDNAKLAEQEWNLFLENARTSGSSYSELDSSRAAQQAADAIRDINRRSQEAGSAQDTAKSIQQFGYAKSLESDAAALARATGIGTAEDSSRVLAKAKSTVSRAYVEDAKSIQSTMPYDLSTNVPELKRQFESSTEIPMARRLAMVWATAQNGNFGYEQAREMIDWYVKHGGEGGGRPTDSDIRDFKELIKIDSSLSDGDRALELFLNEGVNLDKTLEDFTNDMGTWNIKTSRFAQMGETRQLEAIKVWQSKGAEGEEMLNLVRADILSTPTLRSGIKKKVKQALAIPLSPQEASDTGASS